MSIHRHQRAPSAMEAHFASAADELSGIICDPKGRAMLVHASLPATDAGFAPTPHLMISTVVSGGGAYSRRNGLDQTKGVLRGGDTVIGLPNAADEGCAPGAEMRGLLVAASHLGPALDDIGGIEALTPAASRIFSDRLISLILDEIALNADTHGQSAAFFDHALQLILLRLTLAPPAPPKNGPGKPLSPVETARVIELVESSLDLDLKVTDMARLIGRDARGFTRGFRAATGYAPFEFLTLRRMEHAKDLLMGRSTVLQIALAVGYANPAKFAAAFRRVTGVAPSQWRVKHVDR